MPKRLESMTDREKGSFVQTLPPWVVLLTIGFPQESSNELDPLHKQGNRSFPPKAVMGDQLQSGEQAVPPQYPIHRLHG